MRTIDDPDPAPRPPLGHPEPRPQPEPVEEWAPSPDAPGIEINVVTGKRRTVIARNYLANAWWPLCK